MALELGGYFPQVFDLLDPADTKGVSEAEWMACQRQSISMALVGDTITSVKSVGRHSTRRVFAPLGRVKTTIVDVRIAFQKTKKQLGHTTAPLALRRVHGSWKGLLPSSNYKALAKGTCPGRPADFSAYWFEGPSGWAGAGKWKVGVSPPDAPLGMGFGADGHIEYYGPGSGSGELTVNLDGPSYEGGPRNLKTAAEQALSGVGGTVTKGPVKTTLGGLPADAYGGTDSEGNQFALVVTYLNDNAFDSGTYELLMSGSPANFGSGTAAFNAALKHFAFLVLPSGVSKLLPRKIPAPNP